MRLGALAAILGCASSAARRGGGSALDRLVVLVVSAMVASLVWGLCAGLWLARAASLRWDALEAAVRAIASERAERVRWCPASMRSEKGAIMHGALLCAGDDEWSFIERGADAMVDLGREPPTLGARGLGWGAALLGAPCEPLSFRGGIVYVDRVLLVDPELLSRRADDRAKVLR